MPFSQGTKMIQSTPEEGSGVTQNVPQLQDDWATGTIHHFPSFEASPLFHLNGTDAHSARLNRRFDCASRHRRTAVAADGDFSLRTAAQPQFLT